jgi:phosphatidylserine synthase
MNPFLPFVLASFGAACTWTILVMRSDPRHRRFPGLIGAWAGTVVLAALWQAEAVPWLWVFLQGVLLLWLCAIALLIAGLVSIWRVKEPGRRALAGCAMLCIVVNVAAGLNFLWLATTSPGGV